MPVEAGGGHFFEETRHSGIDDRLVQARCLMGKGASQTGFSGACLTRENDLLMGFELADQRDFRCAATC